MKRVIIYGLLFGLIGFMLEYGYYRFSPTDTFFEIQSIEPIQKVFDVNSAPYFSTYAHYKTDGEITRKDIQYCKGVEDEQYVYYSMYETSSYFSEPKMTVNGVWRYNVLGPSKNMQCYLYNITSLELPYGINKVQSYISGPYEYKVLSS